MIKKETLLDKRIKREGAYKYTKGDDIIPIVYNDMFEVMINNEEHKQYATQLLSYFMDLSREEIYNHIVFLKNKLDNKKESEPRKTVDMLLKVKERIINVEVNNNSSKAALERNLEYSHKIYRMKRKKGKGYKYYDLLQLNINNFTFEGNDKTIEVFYLQSDENILTDKIIYVYVYLPNIRKKFYNKEELSEMEKFMLIMNEKGSEEIKKMAKENKIFEEYRKDAEEASQYEDLIEALSYDKEEMLKEVHDQDIAYAYQDGIEEGIEQGIEQGITQEKKEAAINLHKNGASDELICTSLGITERKLKEYLKSDN